MVHCGGVQPSAGSTHAGGLVPASLPCLTTGVDGLILSTACRLKCHIIKEQCLSEPFCGHMGSSAPSRGDLWPLNHSVWGTREDTAHRPCMAIAQNMPCSTAPAREKESTTFCFVFFPSPPIVSFESHRIFLSGAHRGHQCPGVLPVCLCRHIALFGWISRNA